MEKGHLAAVVPIIHILREIADLIPAEGGVHAPSEALHGAHGEHQLRARPVAAAHVGAQGGAHIVQLAGKHQLVRVVHVVQVQPRADAPAAPFVAQFIVHQAFRPGSIARGGFLQVVPVGLAVRHRHGGVDAAAFMHTPQQARLRVEEAPGQVLLGLLQLVADAQVAVAHLPYLQVAEHVKLPARGIVQLGKGVRVGLAGIVVVIAVADEPFTGIPRPGHLAVVFTRVVAPTAADHQAVSAQLEAGAQVRPGQGVVQPFAPDDVRGGDGVPIDHGRGDAVVRQVVVRPELLVVPGAQHAEQRQVEQGRPADLLVEKHLVVGLVVVVHLIVVGEAVVGAVGVDHLLGHTVPGLVGDLPAAERDEPEAIPLPHPRALQEIALQVGRGPVDVAIAGDGGQPHVQAEARHLGGPEQAGAPADGVALRVVRAAAHAHQAPRLAPNLGGAQVHRGPEGGRPVGTGAHAALHLHVLRTGGQVRQVHQEGPLAFGIVERHSVQGDVGASGIRAADPHAGVADTCSCIAGHHHAGLQFKQVWQIGAGVGLFDLLPREHTAGKGCPVAGTQRGHLGGGQHGVAVLQDQLGPVAAGLQVDHRVQGLEAQALHTDVQCAGEKSARAEPACSIGGSGQGRVTEAHAGIRHTGAFRVLHHALEPGLAYQGGCGHSGHDGQCVSVHGSSVFACLARRCSGWSGAFPSQHYLRRFIGYDLSSRCRGHPSGRRREGSISVAMPAHFG